MTENTLHADETGRRVRKVLYTSRGINMVLCGVWMCAQAGMQLALADAAWKPVAQLGMVFNFVVFMLGLRWIQRTRAQQDCHSSGSSSDSVRDEVKLFSVITLGVVGLTALYLFFPQIGEAEWLAPIALSLFLFLGGVFFVYEAIRLKLFELAILGFAFWVGSVLVINGSDSFTTEAQFQSGMVVTQLSVGVLVLALGASLHRRWRLWREQVLSA